MSVRSRVTLTDTYQAVSAKKASITVHQTDGSPLYLNNVANDTAPLVFIPEVNEQIVETENQTIYAKGAGNILTIDQEA